MEGIQGGYTGEAGGRKGKKKSNAILFQLKTCFKILGGGDASL